MGARLTSAVKGKKIFDDTLSLWSSVAECVSLRSVVEAERTGGHRVVLVLWTQLPPFRYKCQDMYFHICSHWITYMVLKRVTYCIPWLQSKLLCGCESISLAPLSVPGVLGIWRGRKELLQGINRSSAPIHHLQPPAVFDEDVGLFYWYRSRSGWVQAGHGEGCWGRGL